jgi:predicted ArsR family transcriptional regulator
MRVKIRSMNLQTEKLQLIEWLARLQDADIVKRLLEVKQDSEIAAYEASLKPMSVEELVARAEESNRAIEAGEHIDIEEALKDLED